MNEWWMGVPSFEKFFWTLAIPFSALFVVQMVLMIIGIDHGGDIDMSDGDVDVDFDADTDIDMDIDSDTDSNVKYDFKPNVPLKLFTIRNIIIFGTIFSWSGITSARNNYGKVFTIVLGVILGSIVVIILSLIFKLILKLTQSGNVNKKNAIGCTGEVYLTIPGEGKGAGKVQVTFQGALRVVDAVTYDYELKTGSKIVVVGIKENLLVVEREK